MTPPLWSQDKQHLHMARCTNGILTIATLPTYGLTYLQCTDHSWTTKTTLLPSYATLPYLTT